MTRRSEAKSARMFAPTVKNANRGTLSPSQDIAEVTGVPMMVAATDPTMNFWSTLRRAQNRYSPRMSDSYRETRHRGESDKLSAVVSSLGKRKPPGVRRVGALGT